MNQFRFIMHYQNFTDLEVYKQCRKLRIMISEIVKEKFPPNERFSLSDQLIRSSRSVTANIAEGYGRYYYLENIRFCRIARGSLEESLEHLITAFDEKYIDEASLMKLKIRHNDCLKLINGYIRHLHKSKKGKK